MLVKAMALVAVVAVSGGATLHDSTITFRRALDACPGALGSVSFALGHARVAASEGVDMEETEADPNGRLDVTLQTTSGNQSAAVAIDQRARSVSAKHVRVELNRRVACILPD
jgi:hypothetical protein